MKAVLSARPFARLASMNSTAALYSRGRSIVAGEVERSTLARCIVRFLPRSRVGALWSPGRVGFPMTSWQAIRTSVGRHASDNRTGRNALLHSYDSIYAD